MDSNSRTLFLVMIAGLLITAPLLFTSPPPAKPVTAKGGAPKAAANAAAPAPVAGGAKANPGAPEELVTIATAQYEAVVSSLSAGLKHLTLKERRYHVGDKPIDVVTTDRPRYHPLAAELDGVDFGGAAWRIEERSASGVRLALDVDGVSIVRKLEVGKAPYQLWVTTQLRNHGAQARKVRLHVATHHYVARASEETGVSFLPVGRSPEISHALCKHAGELERETRDALAEGQRLPDAFVGKEHAGPIAFAGVENTYFLSAVAPESGEVEACQIAASPRGKDASGESLGTLFSARLSHPEVTLAPGASARYRTLVYLGPKLPEHLSLAGHSLRESIETGWFTGLAEGLTWLLREIHRLLGNWGLAIIVLTFVVKTVLYPLTARQVYSMARMKALKPEIDKINEMYPDDREKKGAAMMELYRKRGINPMAGCLPVLVQLPIWFSLYQSLATNVELFRAPFALWWTDLSGPDPYFVLPLALGVLMFVQQKITPAAGMDPVQAKMMLYMMPTMITAFMLFLPAGLCLYMFTNSALSIAQQRLIEARLSRMPPPSSGGPTASNTQDSTAPTGDDPPGAEPNRSKRRSRRDRA